MPYYDDNAIYMLYYYIYYLCIVKLVIITSSSAYIHNKCHLLLTHDWLQYVCCIGFASHNSPIINIATQASLQPDNINLNATNKKTDQSLLIFRLALVYLLVPL